MPLKDHFFGSPENLTMTTEETGGGGGSQYIYVDKATGDNANNGSDWANAVADLGYAWVNLVPSIVTNSVYIYVKGDHDLSTAPTYGKLAGKTIDGGRIYIQGQSYDEWDYTDLGLGAFTCATYIDDFRFTVTGGGLTPEAHIGQWVGDPNGPYGDIHLVIKNTADTIWVAQYQYFNPGDTFYFWRQNDRISSSLEFNNTMMNGGNIQFYDFSFTGWPDKYLTVKGNGYYEFEKICCPDGYVAFTAQGAGTANNGGLTLNFYDDNAILRGKSTSSNPGTNTFTDCLLTRMGSGLFYGETRFERCRFDATFYGGTNRLNRFATPHGSGNSNYVMRFLDCHSPNRYLKWWWVENNHATPAGTGIHMWHSDIQFGEAFKLDGGHSCVRLEESHLRLDCNYTPVPTGSATYGVHCCHNSSVRIASYMSNNPALTGSTADVLVGEAGATSTWATIMGGTPLRDSNEFCYVQKDTQDYWEWY